MAAQRPHRELQLRLVDHQSQISEMLTDLAAYQAFQHDRHDQLTRRHERLERQVDALNNPETARGKKLLNDYERISEQHARSEEELESLENEIMEPLRGVWEVLSTLVA